MQVKPNRGLSPADMFSKHKGNDRRNLDTSGRKSMGSSDTGRPAGYPSFRVSSGSGVMVEAEAMTRWPVESVSRVGTSGGEVFTVHWNWSSEDTDSL